MDREQRQRKNPILHGGVGWKEPPVELKHSRALSCFNWCNKGCAMLGQRTDEHGPVTDTDEDV